MKIKIMIAIMLLSLSSSMIACGKKSEAPLVETKNNDDTETVNLDEYAQLIKDSSWSGVDAFGTAYLVTLKEGTFSLNRTDASSSTTQWEGTCELTSAGFTVQELSGEPDGFSIDFALNGEDSYLKINDVYLRLNDMEGNLENLKEAVSVSEYLGQGHCWIACLKDRAFVLLLDGQKVQMEEIRMEGGSLTHQAIDGSWSMDQTELAVLDINHKLLENFSWSFEEEEELKVLTLTLADESLIFYETGAENKEKAVAMAEQYLKNQTSPEEITDFSTVLKGYEGVSIVDAFILAGLNPSLENRGTFAEKFKIENYRGTAEQNLFLLESMGGTIK